MKAVALQVPPGHPWLDLVSGWTVMGCCSLEFSKIPPEPAQADLQWAQPTLRGRELRTCHQFVVPASFASPVPLGGGGGEPPRAAGSAQQIVVGMGKQGHPRGGPWYQLPLQPPFTGAVTSGPPLASPSASALASLSRNC